MLFNTTTFLVFFAIVYGAYLALRRHRDAQNWMLLAASCTFYGWWDARFLGLLVITSMVDFFIAQAVADSPDATRKKRLILVSLVSNLGVLGFFKYFNFFVDSFATAFAGLGVEMHRPTLEVVLPVGISFYTFQALSYTIDVYRGAIDPIRNLPLFLLFITYFPQLVAGPIERAVRLIPQLGGKRGITRERLRDGAWLVLFGLFKKVVVADNLATLVDPVFTPTSLASGLGTLLSIYAFAFQIYCDFSGYTDMARGISKWLGIELMVNFRRPYFAQNPKDFWQRWHISLSEWLRDYLYISLGGNRGGELATYRNLCITMLLGGLWHGATWMFVLWGAFHGAWLVAHRLYTRFARPVASTLARLPGGSLVAMIVTFHLVCVSWVLFRADTVATAGHVVDLLAGPYVLGAAELLVLKKLLFCAVPLMVVDGWIERAEQIRLGDSSHQHESEGCAFLLRTPAPLRGLLYAYLVLCLAVAAAPGGREFIYFQF